MAKKMVLKLNIHDDTDKQKAFKAVSRLIGIDSISVDKDQQKMTVIGKTDPIEVVSQLRKGSRATVETIGPAEEEKKKDGEKPKQGGSAGDMEPLLPVQPFYPLFDVYHHPGQENPNPCAMC